MCPLGSGEVTLQKLLKAYELVLPRHGARPEEDIYYYRLLLKLSLDPDPDWWGKFRRESGQLGVKTYRISDAESLEDSESEAYQEFRSLATSFRIWRESAAESAAERLTREEAIENWRIAVAFWEVHTARRCLRQWAAHRYLVMEAAVQFWQGTNLRDSFNHWRKVASHLKICGALSQEHSARKMLIKCWGAWREFVDFSQNEEQAMFKAASYWLGRSLHVCFSAWQRYTEACIKNEEHAMEFYANKGRHMVMVAWARVAEKLKRERLAAEAIEQQVHSRVCLSVLRTWHSRGYANQHQTACMDKAVRHWLDSKLRSSWGSWRGLIAWKQGREELATKHATKVLRYLLEDGMQAWMAWHQKHAANREVLRFHASRTQGAKKLRVLVAWRNQSVRMGMDRQERRLSKLMLGWQEVAALAAEHERVVRGARTRAARKTSSEVLYALFAHVLKRRRKKSHVASAISHYREQRLGSMMAVLWEHMLRGRDKRRQMRLADEQRERLLLDRAFFGWMQIHVEQENKMARALMHWDHNNNVRLAVAHWLCGAMGKCFWTWREQAQEGAELKAKMMVACRVLTKGAMSKAFNRWLDYALYKSDITRKSLAYLSVVCGHRKAECFLKLRANAARKRRSEEARAMRRRTLKRTALRGWRARLEASYTLEENLHLVFRKMLGNTQRDAWDAWREYIGSQRMQHNMAYRAAYFWMGSHLRAAFEKLRMNVIEQQEERATLQRVMYFWMNHRLRFAFDKLRENMLDNQNAEQAGQKALYFWFNNRLRVAFDTLRANTEYQAKKRESLEKVLHYWRGTRLGRAFEMLRRNAQRNRTTKALVIKHMGSVAKAVLVAWKAQAVKLARLKDIYGNLVHVTRMRRMAMTWRAWKEWIDMKHKGELTNSKAVGYLRNVLLGRAWNTWMEHHQFVQTATKVVNHMLNLRASRAFQGWREMVLLKKEAMEACTKNQELSNGMAAFKYNVAWQEAKRRADEHFFQVKGRQCLLAWQLAVKLGLALDLWMGNSLKYAFDTWVEAVQEKRRLSITQDTVAKRWRNIELLSAWNAWLAFVEHKQESKARMSRALSFWTRKGQAACWQWWRALTLWRRDMRNVASVIGSKVYHRKLNHSWNGWKEFMYLREAKKRAVACWYWRQLASAFRSWHDLTNRKVEGTAAALEIFTSIATRLASETTSSIFQAWHAHVVQIRGLRLILQKILGRHMEFAFFGWSELARDLKYQREAAECIIRVTSSRPELGSFMMDIVRRWQMWPLSQAFYTWQQETEEHKHELEGAAKALFAYTGCLMRKAFMGWVETAMNQIHMRNKVAGALLGMSSLKLHRAFHFWVALARYLKYMKGAMGKISSRMALHSKRLAWDSWREHIEFVRVARNAMSKILSRKTLGYWNQWRSFVQGSLHTKQKMRQRHLMQMVVNRAVHSTLSRALGKWLDFWQYKTRKTVADVHYYGKLMDDVWLGWREVVEEAAAMRGLEANWAIVCRRALECWRRFAVDAQRARAFVGAMQGLTAIRALVDWRMQTKARKTLRNSYLRRALQGWYERVLYLAQMRFKLQGAVRRMASLGMARAFGSWLSVTQEQNLRRRIFVQKQRAVQEAIRIGDQIRGRRNAELLQTTLLAWHLQAGLFREVASRFGAIMKRGLSSAFR
ncbi:hypothetical protein DUNSADRAFT_5527 [Dunaliella salina]|nr:hypothetical protein DUNSADRAFT_5527 [Dunaliella salina]|eukprot:KAF5836739.1 hypothetical protein DUNSADRAFT_5527 [Dunaliella salina]